MGYFKPHTSNKMPDFKMPTLTIKTKIDYKNYKVNILILKANATSNTIESKIVKDTIITKLTGYIIEEPKGLVLFYLQQAEDIIKQMGGIE